MDSERQRLRRDVAWNMIPVVMLGVVGLGLNFVIGGLWNEDALGVFNLVTSAMFSFAVLGAFGIQYAVLRAIAEQPDDRDRVAAIVVGGLVPALALAAVTTVLYVAASGPVGRLVDSPDVAIGMRWSAIGLFCFVVDKVLLGIVNGLRRMRAYAIYTSLRFALLAIGLAGAVAFDVAAPHLPAVWSFTEGVMVVVLTIELVSTVELGRAAGWRGWTRQHIDYGARGVVATLAYEINSKLDVWMVGVALSDAAVGVYAMAAAMYEGALQLAVVVQNNVNPLFARAVAAREPQTVHDLVRRTRRWFVPTIAVACALGAVGYPLVVPRVLDNPAFDRGALPFAILLGGFAVTAAWAPFNQLLLMARHPGWHTGYVVAVGLVNLIGLAMLVPLFGLVGAAISVAASLVMSSILLVWLARWRVGVRL